MTTIVSSTSFYGNHSSAIKFMKQYGFIPNMLDKSRFNRRLHKISRLLYELFEIVSSYYKDLFYELHYIIDSFPVAVCNNMRIANCKILKDKKWGGYTASIRSYFCTITHYKRLYPNRFTFYTGKTGDAKALGKMIDKLPVEASLYVDSTYIRRYCSGEKMHLIKDSTQIKR